MFSKNEINTSRQFEFDFAKAICILGMVIIHCFELFPLKESAYAGSLYYSFVIVLDAIFGAGTFMICLGVGLTYTKKNKPGDYIKRGIITFILGYVLNVVRYALPSCLYYFTDDAVETTYFVIFCVLSTDIMQFAGLAFILFGLLKKCRLPDWAIGAAALVMSVAGSFLRFIDSGNHWMNNILGLLIGIQDDNGIYPFIAHFAILNWFIFVVFGYFFGKIIRRCENTDKLYAITTPVSAVAVITYMAIAIPDKLGMMCGDEKYYFQMTTLDALIIIMGALLAFGLYHFISKLFDEKVKRFITGLAVNINKTYCIHWAILGWMSVILWFIFTEGMSIYVVLLISIVIYVISSLLAELVRKINDRKKVSGNAR